MLDDVTAVLRDNGLQLDSGLTLALNSMMHMESISLALFPETGLVEEGAQTTLELMQERLTPEKIANTVIDEATSAIRPVMQELPYSSIPRRTVNVTLFCWL